ncbi:hypothetical protein KBD71_02150 [Candidatus Woesebacteria bacterium]|nr:hypothetical protein [Candidatus Woesebacteria bacterium]
MDPSAQVPVQPGVPSTPQVPSPVIPTPVPTAIPGATSTDSAASPSPVLAQQVLDAAATVTPTPTPISSSHGKEVGPISSEVAGFVEMAGSDSFETEPIPAEVASWMEKVNRGEQPGKLDEVVIADPNAMSPTAAPAAATPVYVLPLGETDAKKGLSKNVNESVRWLSEWCKYLMKKLAGQVEYSKD